MLSSTENYVIRQDDAPSLCLRSFFEKAGRDADDIEHVCSSLILVLTIEFLSLSKCLSARYANAVSHNTTTIRSNTDGDDHVLTFRDVESLLCRRPIESHSHIRCQCLSLLGRHIALVEKNRTVGCIGRSAPDLSDRSCSGPRQ